MNIHYFKGAVLKIKSKSNKFKKCQITLKHCLRIITTIGYRSSLASTLTWKAIIKRPFITDVNKDLTPKDQDKDKDLTPKNKDKDKDLTPKDQDKDKDLKYVLKDKDEDKDHS